MAHRKGVDDFQFGSRLGEGSYSQVFKAVDIQSRKVYAIKILSKKHIVKEKKIKYVNIEKSTLNRLGKHPGIVTLYYTFQDENSLYFVIDLAEFGELLTLIRKYGSLSEHCSRYYMSQIIDAVQFMHSKGVIHRDLKPENILVNNDMKLMLTDFGAAKLLDQVDNEEHTSSFVGTAEYVSPELLKDNKCGVESDIWALGCILYQFIVGLPPFKGTTEYLTFEKIVNLDYKWPNFFIPELVKDLVAKLLQIDPNLRLTMPEIQQHPWFKQLQWENKQHIWGVSPPKVEPYNAQYEQINQGVAQFSQLRLGKRPAGTVRKQLLNNTINQIRHDGVYGGLQNRPFTKTSIPKAASAPVSPNLFRQTPNGDMTLAEKVQAQNGHQTIQPAQNIAPQVQGQRAQNVPQVPVQSVRKITQPLTKAAPSPQPVSKAIPPQPVPKVIPPVPNVTPPQPVPKTVPSPQQESNQGLSPVQNGPLVKPVQSPPGKLTKNPPVTNQVKRLAKPGLVKPSSPLSPPSSSKSRLPSKPSPKTTGSQSPLPMPKLPAHVKAAAKPQSPKLQTIPNFNTTTNNTTPTKGRAPKLPLPSFITSADATDLALRLSGDESVMKLDYIHLSELRYSACVEKLEPGVGLDDLMIHKIIKKNETVLLDELRIYGLAITDYGRLVLFQQGKLQTVVDVVIDLTDKRVAMYDYEFDESDHSGYLILELASRDRLIFLSPLLKRVSGLETVGDELTWIDALMKTKQILREKSKPRISSKPQTATEVQQQNKRFAGGAAAAAFNRMMK